MIESIERLGFNNEFLEMVYGVEECFKQRAKEENSYNTMLDWINSNLAEIKEETEGFTDREKFILAVMALAGELIGEATTNEAMKQSFINSIHESIAKEGLHDN